PRSPACPSARQQNILSREREHVSVLVHLHHAAALHFHSTPACGAGGGSADFKDRIFYLHHSRLAQARDQTKFDPDRLQYAMPKRTAPMSALPPKADIAQDRRHVRFVPKADSCTAANELIRSLSERAGPFCGVVPRLAFMLGRATR